MFVYLSFFLLMLKGVNNSIRDIVNAQLLLMNVAYSILEFGLSSTFHRILRINDR